MAGRSNGRVTFEKLQRERARQERQAEKRARRQTKGTEADAVVDDHAHAAAPTQEESEMAMIMRLASQ